MITLRFGEAKIAEEKFYGAEKTINIWNFNINKIIIIYLTEIKKNCKYLIGYLDGVMRPSVLMLHKMKGWVEILNFLYINNEKVKSIKPFILRLRT